MEAFKKHTMKKITTNETRKIIIFFKDQEQRES